MLPAFRFHFISLARRMLICAALVTLLAGGTAQAERNGRQAPEDEERKAPLEGWEIVEDGAAEAEEEEEEPLVYSRVVNIPGLGEMVYYAQNDPLWSNAVYEAKGSPNRSTMSAGACGPTSLAMAIANQVPAEKLVALLPEAKKADQGFRFCECSVTRDYHSGDHEFIDPRTPEDFFQYLPVIFASYATGNNIHYRQFRFPGSGTNATLFKVLAQFYGLTYSGTHDWAVAREALENGWGVITTVTRGIFTKSSHYLYIAGIADGYVYIFDGLMRTEYPADKKHRLEIVEPGVVRVPVEEIAGLQLYGYYMIKAE